MRNPVGKEGAGRGEAYLSMQSLTWSDELLWTLDIACSRMLPLNVNEAMIVVRLVH